MEKEKTLLIRLNGVVQGVGMRYFIYRTARSYGVNGYVKNMADGSVECVIQGTYDVVDFFIEHTKKESPGNITDIDKRSIDECAHYDSFQITY